ncbi:ABC transporter ATP-binding protein [Propylenella binzhouense]|uniref:Spermidine/putrescine import ATP-binding protein PotA n=1 Tax=Propylenella binzhouense TaxID=2555902 RepID=A0A964T5A2_9HYPH|nr:ABC transporter ATP-binding protein [Propylenella binzhouense]MYZ48639.1 ABC transporter ATP-binding protein [Propylenella binzhouense]
MRPAAAKPAWEGDRVKHVLGAVRRSFQPWNDPGAKPFIEFRGVSKRFGSFAAVDGQTLTIYEREFFALLGPSGCGKTTLLRMLAGFEQPSEGTILLEGRDLAGVPPHKRPVNMMFQSYALFPHLTVENNIAFGLKQDRLPRAEIRDRVAEMLRLVRLEGFGKRKPDQLSGGQRQPVALARALAKRPKVLLLDEPLAALDKKLREETQFELINLQETLGLTFVIVTHDQEEAMTVADRIAVMNHGRIVQIATPAEIYEAPRTRYVADFIGSVNIFGGTVEPADGAAVALAGEDGFALRVANGAQRPPQGAPAWIAIRPEKVRISHEPPPDPARNAVAGEVWDIAYLGDMSIYNVRLASGKIVRASLLNAFRTVERPISWEDKVWLSWADDAGVLLAE